MTERGRRRSHKDIDFDRAFRRGPRAYDTAVGAWWEGRARDSAHARAYAQAAAYMRAELARRGRTPRLLIDYACGGGHLLVELARRFPEAILIGLDGSEKMLERARNRLARAGHEA